MVIGALVEFTIIRRFSKSPRLILTVATIGLSSILAGAQLLLPRAFGYNTAPQNFPIPIKIRLEWFPYTYHFGHVMVFVLVPLAAVGLAAFFRFTRTAMPRPSRPIGHRSSVCPSSGSAPSCGCSPPRCRRPPSS